MVPPELRSSSAGLGRFAAAAARAAGVRGEVTIRITSDAVVRELNRRFRRVDAATDVLSFSVAPPPPGAPAGQPVAGGDLAISWETAERQAARCGHGLETEIRVLILHGLLHLAGYDHERDQGRMRRMEDHLRRRFGLPPGLIARRQHGR